MPLFGGQEKILNKILSPRRVNIKIAIEKIKFHFSGYSSWATNDELFFLQKIFNKTWKSNYFS